jgi:two-component system, NtrC family, nitrogen regulation sensor histidine kinase NtrY
MLGAGLVPLLVWGAASWTLLDRVLSLSLAPLEEVLDRVDEELARAGRAPLAAELAETRLHIGQTELARRSLRRLAPWGFFAVASLSAALLGAAALLLGRALSRRLERLTASIDAYAHGDLSARVPEREPPGDELDQVIGQFNRMGAELEAQRRRLEVSEALAAWQEVARTMAHDLKNPLTAMRLSLARMTRGGDLPAERAGELVDVLGRELDVLVRMTESFSEFAKLPPPVPRPLDLRKLLDEVCALYEKSGPVPVVLAPGDAVDTRADADQLRRAFGNLVKNALEASRAGDGPIRVELAAQPDGVLVSIVDDGAGIREPLDGRRLVRSLGTTKPGGSGLGLPAAAKIVHEHGGTLSLEPVGGRGTRALVRLP